MWREGGKERGEKECLDRERKEEGQCRKRVRERVRKRRAGERESEILWRETKRERRERGWRECMWIERASRRRESVNG